MVTIQIITDAKSRVQLERMRIALAELDYFAFRHATLVKVIVRIGSTEWTKQEAFAPDIASELMAWLLSLGSSHSKGYISFGNESFFYFDHQFEAVSLYLYAPEDITDPAYQNLIGTVSKTELINAVIAALRQLRASMNEVSEQLVQSQVPAALVALESLLRLPAYTGDHIH